MPNLLIPKGRDRDILIALKKSKYANVDTLKKYKPFCFVIDCKYWSTDRNDAWELWDELPDDYKFEVLLEWSYLNGERLKSEKFALIVSKAWLQWFYNNKWGKEVV